MFEIFKYKCSGLELGKKTHTQDKILYTDEVIIFVPCATHGHRMIHEQMKHVSNMRKKRSKGQNHVLRGFI